MSCLFAPAGERRTREIQPAFMSNQRPHSEARIPWIVKKLRAIRARAPSVPYAAALREVCAPMGLSAEGERTIASMVDAHDPSIRREWGRVAK